MQNFAPSQRALATFSQGPAWDLMQKVKERPRYDPHLQPSGVINLAGATNGLMNDWLSAYMKRVPPLNVPNFIAYGSAIFGSEGLLNAAAGYFNTFFRPFTPLTGDNVLAANGVTSLIDLITWAVCEPGEGVIYLTPNFYMLGYDVTIRAGAAPIPVSTTPLSEPHETSNIEEVLRLLDTAVSKAETQRKIRCRVLFICNPTNPQGRCYSPETLQALSSWCYRRGMHLVADEIYAMSTFDPCDGGEKREFSSVLRIPTAETGDQHIHCLYSLSKDFNMGGLRMGFLVTRNKAIRSAVSRAAWFTWVPIFADTFVTRFLQQQDVVKDYLDTFKKRLQAAYLRVSKAMRDHRIPFVPSNAGLYIFVDLSTWIKYFEGGNGSNLMNGAPSPELRLCEWLIDHGVFLNAGEFAGSDRPGHFRLVFTDNVDATVLAVKRIRAALDALEKSGPGCSKLPQ